MTAASTDVLLLARLDTLADVLRVCEGLAEELESRAAALEDAVTPRQRDRREQLQHQAIGVRLAAGEIRGMASREDRRC